MPFLAFLTFINIQWKLLFDHRRGGYGSALCGLGDIKAIYSNTNTNTDTSTST